jgi:hypothetical protein
MVGFCGVAARNHDSCTAWMAILALVGRFGGHRAKIGPTLPRLLALGKTCPYMLYGSDLDAFVKNKNRNNRLNSRGTYDRVSIARSAHCSYQVFSETCQDSDAHSEVRPRRPRPLYVFCVVAVWLCLSERSGRAPTDGDDT